MEDPLLINHDDQEDEDIRNATSHETTRRSMLKMSLTIPTKSTVEETYSEDSWRKRILDIVFSRTVELTTAGLILLDVVLAFIELFLMAEYPSCDIIEKYATSCCPYQYDNISESANFDRVLGLTSDENLCKEGVENSDYAATCDENDYPDGVHTAHTILFSMSMIILSIFVIELLLAMIAMGVRQFFGNIYYTFDFIIVSVSVIEVIIFSFDDHFEDSLAGFMMLFRLWRLVRIGHGVLSVDETLDTHLGHTNSLETQNRELKMLLRKNNVEIPDELDNDI